MVIENKGYLLIFTVKKYTKHIRQNDSYWGIWMGTVQITKESRKKTFSERVWGGALRTDSSVQRFLPALYSNKIKTLPREAN